MDGLFGTLVTCLLAKLKRKNLKTVPVSNFDANFCFFLFERIGQQPGGDDWK